MAIRDLVPGALLLRRNDDKFAMIVAAKRPHWDIRLNVAVGWQFELLIDNVLVYTDALSPYNLVQP
jgi:hypothetical protein